MARLVFALLNVFVLHFFQLNAKSSEGSTIQHSTFDTIDRNYDHLISAKAFEEGYIGYRKLESSGKIKKHNICIIDFTKPSSQKRLVIYNVDSGELLMTAYVAHGKNSVPYLNGKYVDVAYPSIYSNQNNSLRSSLGFYITAEVYYGRHGLSLRLDGLDQGFNDKARERFIVLHGASYVGDQFLKLHNYTHVGRSWGCPAVSNEDATQIIDFLKNGACLYIYYPCDTYSKHFQKIYIDGKDPEM